MTRRCPACSNVVKQHCRSHSCPWWRCPREACKAVIDFARRRGIQYLPGDVVRRFAIPTEEK